MILSIIIPVYNIEKYIKKCLESVLLKNIEIIIVIDGSSDGSTDIINEFIKNNDTENVQVVLQENKGLAETRNVGLNYSKGKYIWFVDGDDYINRHYVENILTQIRFDNSDLYTFGYSIVESSNCDVIDKIEYSKVGLMDIEKGLKLIHNPICNVWRYIVKKDILTSNDITFRKSVLCEDIEWCAKIFLHCKAVDICNYNLYNYRKNRLGSIMEKVSEQRIIDSISNIEYTNSYLKKSGVNCKIKIAIKRNLFRHYIYNIYNMNFIENNSINHLNSEMLYPFLKCFFYKFVMKITKAYKKIRG